MLYILFTSCCIETVYFTRVQADLGTDTEPKPIHCGLNRVPICFVDRHRSSAEMVDDLSLWFGDSKLLLITLIMQYRACDALCFMCVWGRRLVSSFFAGRGPAYSGPQRWDLYIGPMHQPRERMGIGRCVRCMCALCRVEEGTVGVSSLSGISNCAPYRRGLLSG